MSAHSGSPQSLGGIPGSRPLVADSFAGGGSIPLEAARVGAEAYASDLNPIPVLINQLLLNYIPRYGQRLADEVEKWGYWIQSELERGACQILSEGPGWICAHSLSMGQNS